MKFLAAIIAFVCFIGLAEANDSEHITFGWDTNQYHSSGMRPRIGLALSGGGARGLSQIGALKAFEEEGFDIAAIAGTSIGGIIGGLYASGYSAPELEEIARKINFNELFTNRPRRTSMYLTRRHETERSLISLRFDKFKPYIPQALTAGQKLTDLLTRLTLKANYQSGCRFSDLPIPFKTVTTDIVSGKMVIIDKGNLSNAMRATMAFPLAFTGIEMGDMLLMDGGMVNPIPTDVVRGMNGNTDIIVAINTSSELLPKDQISDPVDIANQVTSLMTMDKLNRGLELADFVVEPNIKAYTSTSFDDFDSLIAAGYRAGKKIAKEINAKFYNETDTLYISETTGHFNGYPRLINDGTFLTYVELIDLVDRYYQTHDLFYIDIEIVPDKTLIGLYKRVKLSARLKSKPGIYGLQYNIDGGNLFDNTEILNVLSEGDTLLSAEKLLVFSDKLIRMYNDSGYDLAHIDYIIYDDQSQEIDILIDEGKIESININGNSKTKDWLIRSNFIPEIGSPFNFRESSRGISNIYATDLFDRVTINITPGDSGATVDLNVEEKKYTQARLGWHWHDAYKSEQFVEILNDNLLGTGQELMTHFQYGNHRQSYFVYLKADQFFSTYLTYRLKGFYDILERKTYNVTGDYLSTFRETRIGGEFVLGGQISRFGTVTGELRFEEIENDIIGGETERLQLRSLTFRSLVETFNKYPFTNTGKKHHFYATIAADLLGGETEFTKIYSSIESYFQLTDWFNFHPKIEIGHTNTQFGIPSTELFYIGGHYSMYGFSTDELSGAKMFLMNAESRFKLPFNLYFYANYSTGEVYSTVGQIKLKNLRHSFGFSIAYDSPIGPIDLGWGKSGAHPDKLYIDIGLRF